MRTNDEALAICLESLERCVDAIVPKNDHDITSDGRNRVIMGLVDGMMRVVRAAGYETQFDGLLGNAWRADEWSQHTKHGFNVAKFNVQLTAALEKKFPQTLRDRQNWLGVQNAEVARANFIRYHAPHGKP